ncbi:MAG: hypothetical protein ACFFCQ_09320 [Promethearchaeota archaeon]
MLLTNKSLICQHYSMKGYCNVLKVDVFTCPEKCAFFHVKDPSYDLFSEIIEVCRLLQHEGVSSTCQETGNTNFSCTCCLKYNSNANIDFHLLSAS